LPGEGVASNTLRASNATKQRSRGPQSRIDRIITRARAIAAHTGANPDVVGTIFRAMIAALIDAELRIRATLQEPVFSGSSP
jgi:isochorismate pyruvate lyase